MVGGLWLATLAASFSSAHASPEPDAGDVGRPAAADAQSLTQPHRTSADFSGESASDDARQVANWVSDTGDNHSLPFVIVDKKQTKVFVFDGHSHLLGATAALLGSARGDDSAPGIGNRKLSDIRPEERTTAAGRFMAALGPDLGSQDVLWVDYNAALALHRVLSNNSREHRLQRLATVSPLDHRITFGCINVPAKFYDRVVHPVFTGVGGIVYILPEIKTIADVFFIL